MAEHKDSIEQPGPSESQSQWARQETQRALIWVKVIGGMSLLVLLIQPILLIIGALVLTAMIDGGARLLGKVLPIPRGWRLAIVLLSVFMFLGWTAWLAGSELATQAQSLRALVEQQVAKIGNVASHFGLRATPQDIKSIGQQIFSSLGRVTEAVTTVVGTVTSGVMMLVLAIFIAAEPAIYERGMAWMLPMEHRQSFYRVTERMGWTLRRLMAGRVVGMIVEGVSIWLLLLLGGLPMAALLGVLAGILAFLPNIGAIISGVLIILVGFSDGMHSGFYAIGVYLAVQMIDGYLIVPTVARRAVDLAPALVLGAQILFGALFGVLGLALADPIVAMIKVYLEERSRQNGAVIEDGAATGNFKNTL